jgi:hypothetical protein
MADCFDIDSTMTVMETKSGGKSTGENRKVRTRVVLLLPMDISRLGKAIAFQNWTDPTGSRRLRFPDFKTIGT